MLKRVSTFISDLFEKHKLVRRLLLLWSVWLITDILFFVYQPHILLLITPPVANVTLGVIGILATVIGFYQYNRKDS